MGGTGKKKSKGENNVILFQFQKTKIKNKMSYGLHSLLSHKYYNTYCINGQYNAKFKVLFLSKKIKSIWLYASHK